MKSKRTTEKALVLSIISTFLCIAMLAGTTFAWFSQNKSQNVTNITIGGFGVDIVCASSDGLTFYTDAACTTPAGNWQPGETYYMTPFDVKNSGELDLVYKIESNLPTEGLTWYVNDVAANPSALATDVELAAGDSDTINIKCTVATTVSSAAEYNNLKINVFAKQAVTGAQYSTEIPQG